MNVNNDHLLQRVTTERDWFEKLLGLWKVVFSGLKYTDDKCYVEDNNKVLVMCEYRMIGNGYCNLFNEYKENEDGYYEDQYSRCDQCIKLFGIDEKYSEEEQ